MDRSRLSMIERRARAAAGLCGVLCLTAILLLTGCGREPHYSQETPDDLVRSAVEMVQNGDAHRLPDLIYAESDHMRSGLNRLGVLLGNLQKLAAAVQQRFPAQVAELKARAEAAAADGASGGGGFSIALGRRGAQAAERNQDQFRDLAASIFADPYGWIERNATRLGTLRLTDDMATVMVDGKPVLAPVGIPLKLDGDKWYIALPTHLPGINTAFPRTEAEWSIIGSAIAVLNNTVVELTGDVREGRINSIDQLGEKAGEKTIWPGMIAFAAYQREQDVRRRRDRLGRQYDKREREWIRARRDAGEALPERLTAAIKQISAAELDKLSRRDKRPNIEGMSTPEFVAFLEEMLGSGGLKLSLEPGTPIEEIDAALARWERTRPQASAAAKKGG